MKQHWGQHDDGCYACSLMTKGVQVAPSATPTRSAIRSAAHPSKPKEMMNSYERGIARDDRGLPIREDGKVIPIKKFNENRRHYEGLLDANRQPQSAFST